MAYKIEVVDKIGKIRLTVTTGFYKEAFTLLTPGEAELMSMVLADLAASMQEES